MINDNITWLTKIKSKLIEDDREITIEEKREFWKRVGVLKRLDNPDPVEIVLMSEIRELLHQDRFGKPRPTSTVLLLSAFAALGIVLSVILMSEDETIWLGIIISWTMLSVLAYLYCWITYVDRVGKIVVYFLLVFSTVILDLILFYFSKSWFLIFNQIGLIILAPALYLHGRYIGGLISGIKFDGVVRDIYYLVTMKINYQSYLSAKPNKRQWIFFVGGIGTVISSSIASLIALLVFGNPYLFIFPFALFIGELFDYAVHDGRVGKGEFHHLRREHRIIKDWKKSLKTEI
ncbi:MAG: hypothetical protein GPJ54_01290 [Candidatus Heimdallarchaeota archaeon]|nr:hypothetical protein [Candidatus Heimdallarchaeota archaeon]